MHQLAQAVIARFNSYPGTLQKARLLELMDTLIVNCDNTFHQHLAEEGFFQTLISDEKVSLYHPCILIALLALHRFKATSIFATLHRRTSLPGSAVYQERLLKLLVMYFGFFQIPPKENRRPIVNLEVQILVRPRTSP